MRTVYTHFRRKEPYVDVEPCAIEKVVELSAEEFSSFCRDLTERYDFIHECADDLYQDGNGINHCLLVLGAGSRDGVLVRSEGCDWARYHAYLPNARQMVEMDRYPSLEEYNRQAVDLVEEYAKLAVACQLDGRYKVPMKKLRHGSDNNYFQDNLIMEMLSEREELSMVEAVEDDLYLHVAPEFRVEDGLENLRRLANEDLEVMCAKHVLWLHGVGGEPADFSGCYLENMDLSGKNLERASFDGSRLVNCFFYGTTVSNVSFRGARIHDCEMTDMNADGASFVDAKILGTDMSRSNLNNANFSRTAFMDSSISSCHMANCCFEGTALGDTCLDSAHVTRSSYDEQSWLEDAPVPGLQMQ